MTNRYICGSALAAIFVPIGSKRSGKLAICMIDADQLRVVDSFTKNFWHVNPGGYAAAVVSERVDGECEQRAHLMHRVIMGCCDSDLFVDHRNGDTLNNRRVNLRLSPRWVNCLNRHTSDSDRGVRRVGSGRYEARVKIQKQYRKIGVFSSAEEASDAVLEEMRRADSVSAENFEKNLSLRDVDHEYRWREAFDYHVHGSSMPDSEVGHAG